MKERPILFSGPMVRAILNGTKTMTRRAVKPQPVEDPCYTGGWAIKTKKKSTSLYAINQNLPSYQDICPHGKPGDRLWVRETWQCSEEELPLLPIDHSLWGLCQKRVRYATEGQYDVVNPKPWRPSIFMPRWASRLTLELTEVRVERLQDITEADARAEGIRKEDLSPDPDNFHPPGSYGYVASEDPEGLIYPTAEEAFSVLWDSINGKKHPWESNPWVWVESFKVIE